MKLFRNVNELLRKKGVQLVPFYMTVITGLLIVALLVVNIIPYTGGKTDKSIDCRFIEKISYQSVYQDCFNQWEGGSAQLFYGTRLEILNLRKYVYRALRDTYGKPKRFLFRIHYKYENNDNEIYGDMLYRLIGTNGVIVYDYGKMTEEYSKRIGIDETIYYFEIRLIPIMYELKY